MKKFALPLLLFGSLLLFSVFWILNIKAEFDRAETDYTAQIRETTGHLEDLSDAVFTQYKNIFETLARIRFVKEQDTVETTVLFKELGEAFPEIVNFAAVNSSGSFFASGIPIDRSTPPTVKDLYFFKNLAAGKQFLVMEPHIGPISDRKVTGIVVALTNTHNQFNGLVGATFPVEVFFSRWEEILSKQPSFSVMVTDGNGKPFFASGPFFPEGMVTIEQHGYGDLRNFQRNSRDDNGKLYASFSQQSSLSNWTIHLISPPGIEFSAYLVNHLEIVAVGILLLLMMFWTTLLIAKNVRDSRILQESEERFRQLAENIDSVFWISPPDKKSVLYVSPAFETIWGITSQQLYERPQLWFESIHPDDQERIRQSSSSKRELGTYDEEYRVVQPSGKIRWIHNRAFPLRDAKGLVHRIVGIASDITDNKDVENQLRHNEEQSRAIIRGALDGFWLVDRSGHLLQVNNAYCAMSGYSEGELLKKTIADVEAEESHEDVSVHLGKTIRQGSDRFITKHRTKNGSIIDLEVSAQFSEMDGGLFFVFLRNITEQLRSERELKESELKLRTLFANSRDAIGVSVQGQHLFCNPSYYTMFGIKDEACLKELKVLDLIDPSEREKIADHIARRFRGEAVPSHYETKGQRTDGTIFDMEATVSTYIVEGRTHTMALLRDIAARKKAEKEKDILEEQLRQSQKIEALGTLAGGIAHDFNNILAAVLGFTELVKDRLPKGSENEKHLGEVLVAAFRAKELVKQILAFSRKTVESRSTVQVHLVVGEVVRLLRQTIPSTIEIKINIVKEKDTVLADATQLHQVVMNLCTNSYQAMLEKGGVLSLSLSNVNVTQAQADRVPGLTAGTRVLLTVKDSGIGMTPETLMRVFEPFFTTKPVGKGTGMGMSVVFGIIRSHGGAIGIESTLGQGTNVNVYLPFHAGDTAEVGRITSTPRGRGERIMVVDDEPALTKLTCKLMEKFGYSMKGFTSSVDALKHFEEKPQAFDLIITDQTMPEITGINLTRKVLSIRPDIPVIICTGHSETLNEVEAIKAGASSLLGKPLESTILATTIRKALDATSATGSGSKET
jgi:PAS domain S-box-containing protein